MMSDFKEYLLSDVINNVIDNRGKTPPNSDVRTEYELLEVNSLRGNTKNPNYELVKKYVSKDTYDSWFRKGHPQAGDVLIATVGSIGEVALSEGRGCIAQNIIALQTDERILSNEYLYYLFTSNTMKNVFNALNISSVQPSIKVPHLLAQTVKLPSVFVQEQIVQILRALDNKIANNTAMNQTLEKIAQRIFKSWFIDFDPVKANKEGVAFDGLSPEIQALFPSEFEESELGMIPKGWEVTTVKQLQNKLSKGTTPRKKDVETAQDTPNIPFIKVRNINDSGLIGNDLECIANSIHTTVLKRSVLESDDLLFTIAGTIGRVAIVPERLNNSNCNQAVCFIRLKDKLNYNSYLYLHLKSKRIQDQISSKVVQAVQANASLQNINDINFPLPPDDLMSSWNRVTLPIFGRLKEIEKQNITLIGIRDRLLPKLISGQITVGEAQKELAEAI
ncbi:restriction endonuclease subunit S [Vibrio vulnificus]|uniref:restriction endonuclease subunit S n=1 Tax=Vibrio vulnificus TaxID=672 RepID=UPI001CDBECFA|nr:restriction endonuclease subunit S [Vibrio vulnificus]MCA3892028.1 restriction endonuclease subunit S [Vibrio vulnificus]